MKKKKTSDENRHLFLSWNKMKLFRKLSFWSSKNRVALYNKMTKSPNLKTFCFPVLSNASVRFIYCASRFRLPEKCRSFLPLHSSHIKKVYSSFAPMKISSMHFKNMNTFLLDFVISVIWNSAKYNTILHNPHALDTHTTHILTT